MPSKHTFWLLALVLVTVSIAMSDVALAQGPQGWGVFRDRYGNLNRQPQLVATFPTREEAMTDASRRNRAERNLGVVYWVKEDSGTINPLDNIFGNINEQVDNLLGETKSVAASAGMQIPATGDVLGEYRKNIENSYANAQAVKKGLVEFQEKGIAKLFDDINKILDERLLGEGELFLQKQRAELLKPVVGQLENRARADQEPVNELLNRLARSNTPQERRRLVEQLGELQESGALAKAVVSNGTYQAVRDEVVTSEKKASDLSRFLQQNQKRQQEIVNSIRRLPGPKLTDLIGDWRHSLVGVDFSIRPDGSVVAFFDNPSTTGPDRILSTGTFTINGNQVDIVVPVPSSVGRGAKMNWSLRYENGQLRGSEWLSVGQKREPSSPTRTYTKVKMK
jgi:hypothetical protein